MCTVVFVSVSFKFLVLLLYLQFIQSSSKRIYVDCDIWSNETRDYLSNIILRNVTQEKTISEIVVEYGNCGIKRISENAFVDCEELIYLSLEGNEIKDLKDRTFFNNQKLELLKLNNNKLKELRNHTFWNLQKLQYLYLQDNQIEIINWYVFSRTLSLVSLHLENNKILYINKDMFSWNRDLTYLNVNNNPYTCKIIADNTTEATIHKYIECFEKPTSYTHKNDNVTRRKERKCVNCIKQQSQNYISQPKIEAMDHTNQYENIIYGACAGIILTAINLITLTIIIKCCRKQDKIVDVEELIYDEVKNVSIHSSRSSSYAYVEASRSSNTELNDRLAARTESFLEPREMNILRPNNCSSINSYISVIENGV